MPGNKDIPIKPADLLTKQEIDERVALTIHHLDEARKLWPGLRHMSEAERKNSPGKALNVFSKPLALLFSVLSTKKGAARPPICGARPQSGGPQTSEQGSSDRRPGVGHDQL